MRRAPAAVALALALFGGAQVAAFAWIHAKAAIAQGLIERAWSHGGSAPWRGADWRPVARLTVPARHVELFVLEAAGSRALAFGPTHLAGSALPGADGNAVIVAHRDTHFAFLRALERDDEIEVDDARGRRARYRVAGARIARRDDASVAAPTDDSRLTLVTCFPFDALRPGTPWRYVVVAERVA